MSRVTEPNSYSAILNSLGTILSNISKKTLHIVILMYYLVWFLVPRDYHDAVRYQLVSDPAGFVSDYPPRLNTVKLETAE